MRLRAMIVTGVVLLTATGVALGNVHLGQPNASAASPAASSQPLKATNTFGLSESQLEHLADLLAARLGHTEKSQYKAVHRSQTQTVSSLESKARATQSHPASTATRVHHSEAHHTSVSHGSDHGQGAHHGGCDDGGAGCN
jgi:hypothetical protein